MFIIDANINSPVDLAGRLRITTFGPYVSNLGYDPAPREKDGVRGAWELLSQKQKRPHPKM